MNFKTKHNLGQNFLIDNTVINKIINSVNVLNTDKIIEIGPGIGYLTRELKRFNVDLKAFEIDLETKVYLDKLVDEKTIIVYDDFMKVDLNNYYSKEDIIHVIANIPYYITTPIIEKIINTKLNIIDMTLMVQKEVADRLAAKPCSREYGYISVYLNYYYDLNKIIDVSKTCFNPVPKVDSAVIQLVKHNKYLVDNEEEFFKFVSTAFKMKRKNLRNNLRNYDLNKLENVLLKNNLDLTHRAEEISIDLFIEMFNNIK